MASSILHLQLGSFLPCILIRLTPIGKYFLIFLLQ
nr:MAG TPA: hypothetical protein [Caudoviricetes sp.]